jgi:hypothetical protein
MGSGPFRLWGAERRAAACADSATVPAGRDARLKAAVAAKARLVRMPAGRLWVRFSRLVLGQFGSGTRPVSKGRLTRRSM